MCYSRVMTLQYVDHAEDPAAWAASLGVSATACELLLASDFVDLHCDLETSVRLFGLRPQRHHGVAERVSWGFGHTDYPRMREAALTGVVYDIATNPLRPAGNRLATTLRNIAAAEERIAEHPGELALVRDHAGYVAAREAGLLAMWISLLGGNALSADLAVLDGPLGEQLHRITLIHLTGSDLGGTSSPVGRDEGLTPLGHRFIEHCNYNRILVDLAHAGRRTFWDALGAHSESLPPIVSHTGVSAIHAHWHNVDDDQIRAIAERGGVVGIMYQSAVLAPARRPCARAAIIDHLQHVVDLVGEDHAAIGTGYDGAVVPPRDLADITHHPLLVQDMLDRGFTPGRVGKILGGNYLRVVQSIRP